MKKKIALQVLTILCFVCNCFYLAAQGHGSEASQSSSRPKSKSDKILMPNTIVTLPVGSVYCRGDAVSVTFTASGTFSASNTFTAQLSFASGDFSSPLPIGTLRSTQPGVIKAVIPKIIPAGTMYRIRVVASNPVTIGTNNGSNIIINPNPDPTITGDVQVCEEMIEDYSTGIELGVRCDWIVAGGTIANITPTGNAIQVLWGRSGNGAVKLVKTSIATGCADSSVKTIVINKLPKAVILGPAQVCEKNLTQFSATFTQGTRFKWTVTDGTIQGSSTFSQVVVLWGKTGAGSVQLIQILSQANCPDTALLNINIAPLPKPAIIGSDSVPAKRQIKYNTTSSFGAESAWSVHGGSIIGSATSRTVTVVWDTSGTGTITLIQKFPNTGCYDSVYIPVEIYDLFAPAINGKYSVCEYSTEYYTTSKNPELTNRWYVLGGKIRDYPEPYQIEVKWSETGIGSVKLVQSNPLTGYIDSTSMLIVIQPLPPKPAITFDSVYLISSTVYGNQWYLNGMKISGATSQKHLPLVTGYYYVQVNDPNGCPSDMSDSYFIDMTGADDPAANPCDLKPYPNPADYRISLEYNCTGVSTINYSLINSFGQRVIKATGAALQYSNSINIDISTLPCGVYILEVDAGAKSIRRKIIITR